MVRREKFGKLVLLAERESGSLGTESLAARLGPAGLDRLVSVVRYSPAVSGNAAAVGRLVDEARRIARWHDSGLLRLIGVGKVGPTFYLSFEHAEGRTLAAVIERCRSERFPFAADNALLVASRVGATLELLHGRPGEARLPVHGLVVPGHVVVTYAGEVKLTGLGLWPSLRDTGLIGPEETESLAPELARGEAGDVRSDVYSLGRLILHMLTLEPPRSEDVSSPGDVLILGPTGEREPMPEAIAEILRPALAPDPSDRYTSVAEMRQLIDSLLFSGELSSTTFNIAFFMHTLFRHDIEREARAVAEARSADYSEFLATPSAPIAEGGSEGGTTLPAPDVAPTLEAAVAPADEAVASAGGPRDPAGSAGPEDSAGELVTAAPGDSSPRLRAPTPAESPDRPGPPSPGDSSPHLPSPAAGDSSGRLNAPPPPDSSGRRPRVERPSSDSSGRVRTARRSRATPSIGLGRGPEPTGRRGLALLGALLLAVALGGGVSYVYLLGQTIPPRTTPTTTQSPEAEAALARVRELEARIAELERERVAAEQAEAATAEPTAAPAATGGGGSGGAPDGDDEEARAREQAEARQRALVERQRREAEMRRLEEEKSAAEARLVLEQRASGTTALAPPLLPTVAPPPPTLAVPAPTPTPVEPGSLVPLTDPEVTPPVLRSEPNVLYPPLARELRAEGRVVVEALIDENGRVAEARVVTPSGLRVGFEDAALRRVQGRRYAPATKRGVPVKVRINIQVNFTL